MKKLRLADVIEMFNEMKDRVASSRDLAPVLPGPQRNQCQNHKARGADDGCGCDEPHWNHTTLPKDSFLKRSYPIRPKQAVTEITKMVCAAITNSKKLVRLARAWLTKEGDRSGGRAGAGKRRDPGPVHGRTRGEKQLPARRDVHIGGRGPKV
jgi:hypothetical protein